MSKPIEPGCIALVLKCSRFPQLQRTVVTVVESVAAPENKKPGAWWKIDSELISLLRSQFVSGLVATHECNLMRIDGDDYDPSQDIEELPQITGLEVPT